MKYTGYIEEYGMTRPVTLLRNDYQPSETLQRLCIDQDGECAVIWGVLTAVEQPLFSEEDFGDD